MRINKIFTISCMAPLDKKNMQRYRPTIQTHHGEPTFENSINKTPWWPRETMNYVKTLNHIKVLDA